MESIEALWSVAFASNVGIDGAGVAVLEKGRVLGGDQFFYYTGTYEVSDATVTSRLTIKSYQESTALSVFGPMTEFNLELEGPLDLMAMIIQGHVVEHPSKQITMKLTRLAELP